MGLDGDRLNEGGFMEDSMKGIKKGVLEMYDSEGGGGGQGPDLIKSG
ncbi:hypothetical protein [Staphylococcus pasteuri]|nr:hypothetical protein [Staphylococcus pasteuri]